MSNMLKVTLLRSTAGRLESHRACARGLGLRTCCLGLRLHSRRLRRFFLLLRLPQLRTQRLELVVVCARSLLARHCWLASLEKFAHELT